MDQEQKTTKFWWWLVLVAVIIGLAWWSRGGSKPPTPESLAAYFTEQLTDPSVLLPEDYVNVPGGKQTPEGAVILLQNVAKRLEIELTDERAVDAIVALLNSSRSEEVATVVTEIKEFAVTGDNFSFSPAEIKVKQGDRVKIIFTNARGNHDFKLDEFAVATKLLKAGESETVEFVASKTGSFEYYCSVGTHRAMGMVGKLVVE